VVRWAWVWNKKGGVLEVQSVKHIVAIFLIITIISHGLVSRFLFSPADTQIELKTTTFSSHDYDLWPI
jgi:hypothetical protein